MKERRQRFALCLDNADNEASLIVERVMESAGWGEVALSQAAAVSVQELSTLHPHAAESYRDALESGFAAIVFSDPII